MNPSIPASPTGPTGQSTSPTSPTSPSPGDAIADTVVADTAVRRAVEAVVRSRISPVLRAHAGDVEVRDVVDGRVELRFVGACRSCAYRPATFEAAVRAPIMAIDGVEGVTADGVRVSEQAARRARTLWAAT